MQPSSSEEIEILKRAFGKVLPQLSPLARQRFAEEVLDFGRKAVTRRWNLESPDFHLTATHVDRSTPLSRALRNARNKAGISREDVLRATKWSLSKFSRLEAGDISLSVPEMMYLLTLYRVTTPEARTKFLILNEEDRKMRRQR